MDRDRADLAAFMAELGRLKASAASESRIPSFEHWLASQAQVNPDGPAEDGQAPKNALESMQDRVDVLAAHMSDQFRESDQALRNTGRVFDQLLWETENLCMCFQQSMSAQEMPTHQIYSQIDADRSVGILNVMWHTVSFTARGNTKPMAMYRFGQEPAFTGRIVALLGDFHELTRHNLVPEFSDLLPHEVASLYVPADPTTPAVMSIKHLGDEEFELNQPEAARQFLLKVIEMVCAGGYFHEQAYH